MRKTIRQNLAYDDEKHLYYVTMHYGMTPDGRRLRCVRTFRRLEDAERALAEFLQLRAARAAPERADLTLGEWLERWLRDFIRPNRERTTVHGYECMIRGHLVPALGSVRLSALSGAHLQAYYADCMAAGLSRNSVRKHHVLLHTALEAAVRQGLVRENATCCALPPAREQPRHRYYDTEQLRTLFRACAGDPLEVPIKLAGYLGLRRSEICGLKWRSVDLDACVIRICEVRTAVGGLAIEKPPKTSSSLRRLGYGGVDDLEELLVRLHQNWERARHECRGFNPEGYVAVTAEGRPWGPDALGSHVAAFIAAHGLPPISLHGLRHSFASVANSRSVPMFTISKALGHSSTSITSAVYTHLFDETVQDVVSVVADAIVRCGQSSVSMS